MDRPTRVEHFRWLGDKRTQYVYDLDEVGDEGVINELIGSEQYLVFGPDTLAEARNRGYRRARRLTTAEYFFESGGLRLTGHLAEPERPTPGGVPGLVICHGFPSPTNGRLDAGRSYYDLADRICDQLGWVVLSFTFRGCGESEGDFSLGGWLADTRAATKALAARPDVRRTWIAGFGTGGALAISLAAADSSIAGVAALAPPADFDDWVQEPDGLLGYARRVGAISTPGFPEDEAAWSAELASIRAVAAAEGMADRPLLVMHGGGDDVVSSFDARVIADAHGSADLRIIDGGGHRLRFDPRAVAVLIGWLDRSDRELSRGDTEAPDDLAAAPA